MVEFNSREFTTPGIPDACFIRNDLPMTKEEIRCLTICKARLKSNSVVYDVGAGIGAIAVEAALLAREGMVYAIEKEPQAQEAILKNASKFGVGNLKLVCGEAPEAFSGLPFADRIIVGGSGGRLKDILTAAGEKLRAKGRIIVNAITVETLATAVKMLQEMELEVNTCSLMVAKEKQAGKANIFKALNPVFLVVGERD